MALCAVFGIDTPLSDQLTELLHAVVQTRSAMFAMPAPLSVGPLQVTVRSPSAGMVVAVTFVTANGAMNTGIDHVLTPNVFTDRSR